MSSSGTDQYRTTSAEYVVKEMNTLARTVAQVHVSDLEYIASELRSIRRPRRWLSVLASIFAGVSVTALFAGIAGLVAHSTMPGTWRVGYLAVGAVTGVFTVVLYAVDQGESSEPEKCARRALQRMIDLEIATRVEEPERHPEWQRFVRWLKEDLPWTR